jgi:hypothetical protein
MAPSEDGGPDETGVAPAAGQPATVVWEGDLHGGTEVVTRIRRLDEHNLLVEECIPGSEWEATDDGTAARAYERALLEEIGDRGLPVKDGTTPVAPASPPVPGDVSNTDEAPELTDMDEDEMTDYLKSFLEGGEDENGVPFLNDDPSGLEGPRVSTFREAGLLTGSAGIVISLPGGAEYQVTVVRSK